jgi:Fuc2NAc and GlcNAc transferase
MTVSLGVLVVTAFVASAGMCGLVRSYSLARGILDQPNSRSSHSRPTPRGGGLAIAVVVVAGLLALYAQGRLSASTTTGLVVGGALVAGVGWLDDRTGISIPARLAVHVVASVWLVGWLGGMPDLTIGGVRVHLGVGGGVLAVLATTWSVNFYNFMDGIDGLAAAEALFAGTAGALLLGASNPGLAQASALAAAASAGFLLWNWCPARLFMGDVGSGFLGFLFAGLALATERADSLPAVIWLILLGVFFWDATSTLIRRLIRGDRWYAPHRAHAYQRAVLAGWSHARVTVAVLLLDIALGGLAWWASAHPAQTPIAIGIAVCALGGVSIAVERLSPLGHGQ